MRHCAPSRRLQPASPPTRRTPLPSLCAYGYNRAASRYASPAHVYIRAAYAYIRAAYRYGRAAYAYCCTTYRHARPANAYCCAAYRYGRAAYIHAPAAYAYICAISCHINFGHPCGLPVQRYPVDWCCCYGCYWRQSGHVNE